jgi:hypothetical protein
MDIRATTLGHHFAAGFDAMRDAVQRFDDTTVNLTPPGANTNSAAVLVTHACAAVPFWVGHVGLAQPTARDRDAEFLATASVAELVALVDATSAQVVDLVGAFDDPNVELDPRRGDNDWRAVMPEGDRSDGAAVLYAMRELLQHVGHLELTADVVAAG